MQRHNQAEKRVGVRVTGKTSIAHGHIPLPKHKRGELELAQ